MSRALRPVLLVYANCQGESLARILAAHPWVATRFEVRHHANFTRTPVPAELFDRCEVLLYQWQGAMWGDLAGQLLAEQLLEENPRAQAVCIPNLLFTGYWPQWTTQPRGFEQGDRLLNLLFDRGLTKAEILHLYLRGDPGRFLDLEGLMEKSMRRERDKEQRWSVPLLDWVLERWREERLFTSFHHPRAPLTLEVARRLCKLLDWPEPPAEARAAARDIASGVEQPIHPGVARRFKLGFVDPEARWNCFGVKLTLEQYANLYLDCRLAGRTDFLPYMCERLEALAC